LKSSLCSRRSKKDFPPPSLSPFVDSPSLSLSPPPIHPCPCAIIANAPQLSSAARDAEPAADFRQGGHHHEHRRHRCGVVDKGGAIGLPKLCAALHGGWIRSLVHPPRTRSIPTRPSLGKGAATANALPMGCTKCAHAPILFSRFRKNEGSTCASPPPSPCPDSRRRSDTKL